MPQPSFGNMVPPKSFNDRVLRWLRDHDQRITELATARSGQAMQIGKGGISIVREGFLKIIDTLTETVLILLDATGLHVNQGGTVEVNDGGTVNINDGGGLYLRTLDGHIVVRADRIPIPDGSGRKQQVFAVYRDDGTPVFIVADLGTAPGHPHGQDWTLLDHIGNTIFAEDIVSGQGIAHPMIPSGAWVSNSVPLDITSSGSFETVQTLVTVKEQPQIVMQILVYSSDGSTTGELRVTDQDGNIVGGTHTISAGVFEYLNIGPTPLAGTFEQAITLNLQIRRTAGTGTIGVRGVCAIGQPS